MCLYKNICMFMYIHRVTSNDMTSNEGRRKSYMVSAPPLPSNMSVMLGMVVNLPIQARF